MTMEARVQALLDLVEADRARRCATIEADAQTRANSTRVVARTAALQRLRTAFKEERERRDARIAAARAKLQTHLRLQAQRRAVALLAAGWQRLPEVLCDRWLSPDTREAWVRRVVSEARTVLPNGSWRIEHASNWLAEERARWSDALRRDFAIQPQCVDDATIRAGLRISAGGNIVDGTLSGLLADRSEVGARLLGHLEDA